MFAQLGILHRSMLGKKSLSLALQEGAHSCSNLRSICLLEMASGPGEPESRQV